MRTWVHAELLKPIADLLLDLGDVDMADSAITSTATPKPKRSHGDAIGLEDGSDSPEPGSQRGARPPIERSPPGSDEDSL